MTDHAQPLLTGIQTPALLIDADVLERNIAEMAAALPGAAPAPARQGAQVHGPGQAAGGAWPPTF